MVPQSGTIARNTDYSRQLNEALKLRYEPVAVKMILDETDVPEHAIHPMRDLNKHMALCQAFLLARRDRKTVYLKKEDHWCWNPLVGLGHVDCGEDTRAFEIVCTALGIPNMNAARRFFKKFPRFPMDLYIGIVTAPLAGCPFDPDVLLIYSDNIQLRSMLWTIKSKTGKIVATQLDAIDSCIYEVVVPMQTGEYRVTLPDLGESERALSEDNEIVLSVPGGRMDEFVTDIYGFFGFDSETARSKELVLDFARPPFYNELFELWGLEKGEDWISK